MPQWEYLLLLMPFLLPPFTLEEISLWMLPPLIPSGYWNRVDSQSLAHYLACCHLRQRGKAFILGGFLYQKLRNTSLMKDKYWWRQRKMKKNSPHLARFEPKTSGSRALCFTTVLLPLLNIASTLKSISTWRWELKRGLLIIKPIFSSVFFLPFRIIFLRTRQHFQLKHFLLIYGAI